MITIIDYGLGNIASVANALKKLEIPFEISSDVSVIGDAKALILPGVGAAGQGMRNLTVSGIDKVIVERVKKKTPILGICLGMQLFFSSSEEGNVRCLGLVSGEVKKFNVSLKVPQIGWNQVESSSDSVLFKEAQNKNYLYFVNSYYCEPNDKKSVKGTTDYGITFCSVLEKGNVFGVQFHPEKSGEVGLRLLKNFWEAVC